MLKLIRTKVFGRSRPLPLTQLNPAHPAAIGATAWRTGVLAAVLGLLSGGSALAQVGSYGFSTAVGLYAPIAGGTVLGVPTNDDTSFGTFPIGFPFYYNGTNYTTFGVNSNGFIALGSVPSNSYAALRSSSTNNLIAAFNNDLQGNTTTGELSYLTTGSAPNRRLVVQWKSYRNFAGSGQDYNFQIQLNETSNSINFGYGAFTLTAITNSQVGLRGNATTDFLTRTGTDLDATTVGASNSATVTSSSTAVPTPGRTFTFTLPTCVNPTITAVTSTLTTALVTYANAPITPGAGYQYRVATSAALLAAATYLTAPANSFTISGLSAATTYLVQMRANCGAGSFSTGTIATTFATTCPAVSAGNPSVTSTGAGAQGGFETVTPPALPACYNALVAGGGSVASSTTIPITGTRSARITTGTTAATTNRDILILPQLSDLGGGAARQLRFTARMASGTGSILVGTISGTGATAVFTPIQAAIPLNTAPQTLNVDFTAYVGSNRHLAIKPINSEEQGGTNLLYVIDDLNWEMKPACPIPSAFQVNAATVTSSGATVTYSPHALNQTVQIFYGTGSYTPVNFNNTDPGYVGQSASITGSSYTLTGLLPNTAYRAFIRANCAASTTSTLVGPATFTTASAVLGFAITRTTGVAYTSIVPNPATLPVPFATISTDDQVSNLILLPFAFSYNPTGAAARAITGVKVSTNGNIQLQGPAGATSSPAFAGSGFSTTTLLYTLAPFFIDLNQTLQAVGGTHKYLMSGTAPNRVLTVEWVNTQRFANAGTSFNFQVKMYETSNKIEYCYGTMTAYNGTTVAPMYDYVLGLKGAGAATELAVQQRENTNYFQNALRQLNLTPDCNSKITFTSGAYSGTPPPAITAPANDLICAAQTLAISYVSTPATQICTYYRSNLATPSPVGTPAACGTAVADDDVWFKVTTPATGGATTNLQIRVAASNGYTPTLQIFTSSNGTCTGTLTPVGTCLTGVASRGASQSIAAPSLITYFIRVYHAGASSGAYGQFAIDAFGLPTPPARPAPPVAISPEADSLGNAEMVFGSLLVKVNPEGFTGRCGALPPAGCATAAAALAGGRATLRSAAELAANQLSVFPNPATRNAALQVQLTALNGSLESVTIQLVDALGRVVATQNLPVLNGEGEGSLSTRSLNTGVYTLRLTAGAQTATRRVVIE